MNAIAIGLFLFLVVVIATSLAIYFLVIKKKDKKDEETEEETEETTTDDATAGEEEGNWWNNWWDNLFGGEKPTEEGTTEDTTTGEDTTTTPPYDPSMDPEFSVDTNKLEDEPIVAPEYNPDSLADPSAPAVPVTGGLGTPLDQADQPLLDTPPTGHDSVVQVPPVPDASVLPESPDDSKSPLEPEVISLPPATAPTPLPCNIGFFRSDPTATCQPCRFDDMAGVVWKSVGTSAGVCEYTCADGFEKKPGGGGCRQIVPEKVLRLKMKTDYKTPCTPMKTIPFDTSIPAGMMMIMLYYHGPSSFGWPIYVSNLNGDVVKIPDFGLGSTVCKINQNLVPKKEVKVLIPVSSTGTYVIAYGTPKDSKQVKLVMPVQNINSEGYYYRGKLTIVNPIPEMNQWFPQEARTMKKVAFKKGEINFAMVRFNIQ